jgi:hypothetical protein
VDFGAHLGGTFTDLSMRAHNFGFDPLQARLSINAANFAGGDGRFSIVGGFSPSLLSGTGQTYNIHFDDTGATLDQVYTGTLTLSSADEPLPGAAAQPDLVVTLRAKPTSTVTGVGPSDRPTTLAFYPPAPNPLQHEANFAFDLPNDAPVNLAIFDLGGRRIATLASGTLPAARYHMTWRAVSDAGTPVKAGLYFARFDTPGLHHTARLAVLQ